MLYESDGLRIINSQCQNLPMCPVCGGVTNLDEITVERAAEGGGRWIGYILRCLDSADPHGMRQVKKLPICTFAVPLQLTEEAE